jgi:hypothetical protein
MLDFSNSRPVIRFRSATNEALTAAISKARLSNSTAAEVPKLDDLSDCPSILEIW